MVGGRELQKLVCYMRRGLGLQQESALLQKKDIALHYNAATVMYKCVIKEAFNLRFFFIYTIYIYMENIFNLPLF